MARKPRDFDTELQALTERTKKLKGQKTAQLGELVQVTGADSLPAEALAGVLLAATEQAKKQPEAVARWIERGQAFFQQGGKRGRKSANGAGAIGGNGGAGEPAPGAAGDFGPAVAPGGGA